jgi:hypothetical protein
LVGLATAEKVTTSDATKTWFFVAKNGKVYEFATSNTAQGDAKYTIESALTSILASVKFQEVIDVSGWPDYKVSGTKLSFKYPTDYKVNDSIETTDFSGSQARVITVQRENSDLTASFKIAQDYCVPATNYYCAIPLDLKKSDNSIMGDLTKAFNVMTNIQPFWNFKRVTINGSSGIRFYLFQGESPEVQTVDAYVFPFLGVKVGKKTSTNIMITGPALYSGDWSNTYKDVADAYMQKSQDWINGKKYNVNVSENYKLFNLILTTLKMQ